MASDLALAADPGVVERAADPGEFIVQACERARAWLREALEHGEIEQIAEVKSQAEAVRVYTVQKQLGRDAQLSAAEIVRRAERGIGLAIRKGQESGEIRRKGQGGGLPPGAERPRADTARSSPADFASESELRGNAAGIYHLADGVADEDFEAALAGAKAEGNLSRANVVRKLRQSRGTPAAGPAAPAPAGADRSPAGKSPATTPDRRELIARHAAEGMSSRQIGDRLGIPAHRVRLIAREHQIVIPADAVVGRTRRHDANRIVRETAHALEGLAMGTGLVDLAELDPVEAAAWAASLARSIRRLSKFVREMREVTK